MTLAREDCPCLCERVAILSKGKEEGMQQWVAKAKCVYAALWILFASSSRALCTKYLVAEPIKCIVVNVQLMKLEFLVIYL